MALQGFVADRRKVVATAVTIGFRALVAIALLGCGRQVPGPYEPEVAGLVVSIEPAGDNLGPVVLDNGQSFTANLVDGKATTFVYRRSGQPGDLLLAGTKSGPWVAFLGPAALTTNRFPADCYALYGWGTDEGGWIQTDVGLRLRKAPGFDPGLLPETPDGPVPTTRPGLRYDGTGQTFCINREGLVTLRDWGTYLMPTG